jgi:hypothetical protein
MALLTILLLVFAFVFSSFGLSSSSTGSGTAEQIKPVVKCSQRMPADKAPAGQERRCGPPPANP